MLFIFILYFNVKYMCLFVYSVVLNFCFDFVKYMLWGFWNLLYFWYENFLYIDFVEIDRIEKKNVEFY